MKDLLLIFDAGTGEVSLGEKSKFFDSFILLEKADPSKTKVLFRAQLKVLFYVYSSDSPLIEKYTPAQRKEFVYKELVKQKKEKVESDEFRLCEKMLVRHSMTREQAQFHQLQVDFDKFLDHLNNIPWEREIEEFSSIGKKKVTKKYKVSNMDERLKAIKNSKDILTLQKELQNIVFEQQRTIDQGDKDIRLFEDEDYIKMLERSIANEG